MDFSTQALTDDTKSMSDLLELVEKQKIQLNEKDKELATKEQKNKELSAKLNLVMARAYEMADELKAALATSESEKKEYQQTIQDQAYKIQLEEKNKELDDKNEEENKESSVNLDLVMSRANQVDELKDGLVNAQQMNEEQLEANKIQLEEKDKELDDKNEENKESSANLDLAMSQANQVDEFKTELDSSNETEDAASWTRTAPMDSTSHTAADDIIGVSSGMEMANKKLMIQQLEEKKILMEEKIKELEANEVDMQKLLIGYECGKADANQANAEMVEIAKRLTVVVTKQKKCLEIHKEFIDKLLVQLKEKGEQLEEKKQANEELLANLKKSRFFILADDVA